MGQQPGMGAGDDLIWSGSASDASSRADGQRGAPLEGGPRRVLTGLALLHSPPRDSIGG